jgi:predicted DNA-binding transcriptional regulator
MRTVTPEVETVEYPVEFLDGQDDRLVGHIRRCLEALGLQALESKTEAVALPIKDLHTVAWFVEKHKKYRVEHGDLDIQLDQRCQTVNRFSEIDGVGIEVNLFDFGVGTHHGMRAPERNRELSIGDQLSALNVGFM